jgi:hypothetical protein
MLHYTINTADIFDCSQKQFQRSAIKTLRPIADRAIAEGQTQSALPNSLSQYSVKITTVDGAAVFDTYSGGDLLNVNAVAWTADGAAEVWDLFESLYLRLSREFSTLSISRAPAMPDSLPWLTTLILPSPQTIGLNWLPDFEQCLALALIQAAQPKKKSRGFGRG